MSVKSDSYKDYYKKIIQDGVQVKRPEYPFIVDWIAPESKVLDLGCGEGSLGELLIREKKCSVHGIDISEDGVNLAKSKGVVAGVGDIDSRLEYRDDSFDYVILNVVLQMVYSPESVLNESIRVGKQVIISFPNFGFLPSRIQYLLTGRFPTIPLYGYQWYNTRHIHLFSYGDLKDFLKIKKVSITDKIFLKWNSRTPDLLSRLWPNMFSALGILLVKK